MAYGGINKKMDVAVEIGRNSTSKIDIQPYLVRRMNRLTRDGRPNLSRGIKFSGANGDREIFIFSA